MWTTSCYVTLLDQNLKWAIFWHPMSPTVNMQCAGENPQGLLKPNPKMCQLWDILVEPHGMYTPMQMWCCVKPGEKRAFSSHGLWNTSGAKGLTAINVPHLTPFKYVVPNWSPTKIHMEIRIATLDGHETVLLNFRVHHFIQNVGGFSLRLFQVSWPNDINPINLPYLGTQENLSE